MKPQWKLLKQFGTLACLLVAALLAPMAAAHVTGAVSTGSGGPEQWAYGYQQWANTTTIASTYTEISTSYYVTEVVTKATNTSNSTVDLQGTWAWAYTYDYRYCAPNCTHAKTTYNLTLSEWAKSSMFTNTTSAASVYENHTRVAAFGISNGSYASQSNYSERYIYTNNGSTIYDGVAFSGSNASWFDRFTPALGLIPWTLHKNATWNSSARVFTGAESDSKYLYVYHGYGEDSVSRGDAYAKYSLPSNETLVGRDTGNTTLSNGQNATSVSLAYQGPYYVAYGLFYAPQSGTVYGGATQNWSVGVIYGTLAATPTLFVQSSGSAGHYQIVGGVTAWKMQVSSVGISSTTSSPGRAAAGAAPTSATSIAQPEAVGFAQAVTRCLAGGCSGPAPSAPTVPALVFPAWAIAAVVVGGATGLMVGLLFRSRHPRGGSR